MAVGQAWRGRAGKELARVLGRLRASSGFPRVLFMHRDTYHCW